RVTARGRGQAPGMWRGWSCHRAPSWRRCGPPRPAPQPGRMTVINLPQRADKYGIGDGMSNKIDWAAVVRVAFALIREIADRGYLPRPAVTSRGNRPVHRGARKGRS